MAVLTNIANFDGMMNDIDTGVTTSLVTINLIEGLEATKEADQENWVNGPLEFTITITNNSGSIYVAPVMSDTIDPTIATLVAGTVQINGVDTTDYTFDDQSGLLTVNLEDMADGAEAVVTFQIEKV